MAIIIVSAVVLLVGSLIYWDTEGKKKEVRSGLAVNDELKELIRQVHHPDPPVANDNLEQLEPPKDRAVPEAGPRKIDINLATVNQLQELPGIGPTKAQAILDYREANGLFATVEELMNVKGIGPKTFENMKQLIIVSAGEG